MNLPTEDFESFEDELISFVRVDISIKTDIDDYDSREIYQCGVGKILYVTHNPSNNEESSVQIGEIVGYRLFGEISTLTTWAEFTAHELSKAVEWLSMQAKIAIENGIYDGFLYIDKVCIDPQWRGKGLTLKAVAAYIEVFARNGFVFLTPAPLAPEKVFQDKDRQILRLRQFWEKLGLSLYDSDANILWEPGWSCPPRLAGKDHQTPV
jgi:GNAT superfamily N-acetyltransferase